MTVTTTVKGYFHITADSLDVAQTFIDIVNELHPEKYEWSTEIGPGITLWSPRPDDKMCYGIPFQAKGRNNYRKNLIDMHMRHTDCSDYQPTPENPFSTDHRSGYRLDGKNATVIENC